MEGLVPPRNSEPLRHDVTARIVSVSTGGGSQEGLGGQPKNGLA